MESSAAEIRPPADDSATAIVSLRAMRMLPTGVPIELRSFIAVASRRKSESSCPRGEGSPGCRAGASALLAFPLPARRSTAILTRVGASGSVRFGTCLHPASTPHRVLPDTRRRETHPPWRIRYPMNSEFLPTARPPQDAGACAVGWPSWRLEPMAAVLRMIQLIGPADVTALVLGETGVGKEMVAQALHRVAPRRNGPFVKINCAAMPYDLLESELFGYERGAFTGAERRKLGRFEQANRGTIFLDEIAEMALSLQAKLLHVLQDGTFSRLGGREDIRADVRVVAATNRDLRGLVERGGFREDLYYRLCVVNIRVPA